jgi:hypothetical protein
MVEMVRPERFELPTLWFEAKCSIQLSYGRTSSILQPCFCNRRLNRSRRSNIFRFWNQRDRLHNVQPPTPQQLMDNRRRKPARVVLHPNCLFGFVKPECPNSVHIPHLRKCEHRLLCRRCAIPIQHIKLRHTAILPASPPRLETLQLAQVIKNLGVGPVLRRDELSPQHPLAIDDVCLRNLDRPVHVRNPV